MLNLSFSKDSVEYNDSLFSSEISIPAILTLSISNLDHVLSKVNKFIGMSSNV